MMRKRRQRLLLTFLVSLLISHGLMGQLYNMVTYSLKDGLPEERLNCLMQDSDGYIWIGARFGLYKFNGKKFSAITLPLTVGNKFVNNLLEDSKKRIWVCLNGSGLIVFENNQSRQILLSPENTGLNFSMLNAATVNSINRIYEIKPDLFLVLTDRGAFLYDTHRFTLLTNILEEGIPPGYPAVYSASYANDSIWLQCSEKLYLLKVDSNFHPSLLKEYDIKGVALSKHGDGKIWVGGIKGLGYLDSRDHFQHYHILHSFESPNNGINNLFSEGNYTWASTNEGLLLFKEDLLKMHLRPSNGLPSSLIKDILKDREQNYWLATDRGLVLFNDTLNKTFLHANDRSVFVNSIAIDSTGTTWCIQDNLIIWKIKNNETKQVFIHPVDLLKKFKPRYHYTHIFSDHQKKMWVVYNEVLLQVDYNGKVLKYFELPPWLNSVFEDKSGNFWLISDNIMVLHKNRLMPVSINEVPGRTIHPSSMIIDKENRVWLADNEHELHLGKINWKEDMAEILVTQSFSGKDGLSNTRYAQLAYDESRDEIWAGSYWNGISRLRYRSDKLETLHFNYANGFMGERLLTIFFDGKGGLFCRSSGGLFHFTRNGNDQYSFDRYTVADGLPANEIHSLCRDSAQNFWVGTHEGITYFHPAPKIKRLPPPVTFVEKISVNGEPDTTWLPGNKFSLKHQDNALSFEFYATSYRNNNRLLYSYFLEGFDQQWSPFNSQNSVNYKNLPSGKYRFLVKAKNFLGIESSQPATIFFNIATPFHKTGWFYILLAVALLSLIVLIYRYRISQVRHEENIKSQFVQQLSQLEIKALRSQMNPHFIFNSLNAINRYILKNDKNAASAYLTKFAKLIRIILDHSRQPRVPLAQELNALELYLQLESLRFQNNFEYAVTIDNNISPQSAFIPPMIIQPIVENAIWHGLLPKGSNCSLKIDFHSNGSNLICVIEDNGIGRIRAEEIQQQQTLRKSSVGMSTTIQRLKLLTEENHEDASITVEDLYDKQGNAAGTKVKILIPYTYK